MLTTSDTESSSSLHCPPQKTLVLSERLQLLNSASACTSSKDVISVPVTMFGKEKVSSGKEKKVPLASSLPTVTQSFNSEKFSKLRKSTQKVVPQWDDFAFKKKKKEDAKSSAASDAMIEVSTNLKNVSSKISDYIELKMKLLQTQVEIAKGSKNNEFNDFFELIKKKFISLPINDQQEIVLSIIKKMEDFSK